MRGESRRSSFAEMKKNEGRIFDMWSGHEEFGFGCKVKMPEKHPS